MHSLSGRHADNGSKQTEPGSIVSENSDTSAGPVLSDKLGEMHANTNSGDVVFGTDDGCSSDDCFITK